MIQVLIGHRGCGKTSFLYQVQAFAREQDFSLSCLDLDREIERSCGRSLATVFAASEKDFRQMEVETLERLIQEAKGPTLIALGAGFEGPMPKGLQVLWIRRSTDCLGRSFIDRPRLNPNVSPLEEYCERFNARELRFADWADEQLVLPEGYTGGLEDFIFAGSWKVPYAITILSENFKVWSKFLKKRMAWGVGYWELRDDLLTPDQLALALETLPRSQILYSSRLTPGFEPPAVTKDWPLELGEPDAKYFSLSIHERQEDFKSTLAKISDYQKRADILKLAVEIKDFGELKQGHSWWLQDPSRRSFLPRSATGQWRWYRSLFGPRMPLHFVREGNGSALDQPLLWQTQLQPLFDQKFAAILGSPVEHSRTPLEHLDFFKIRGLPVVAVDIPEEEYAVAIDFLISLGLAYAAVTAPLKKLAWAHADRSSPIAKVTQAGNTLYIDDGKTIIHNTDALALHDLSRKFTDYPTVWLWGGGGIKASVLMAWPNAIEISARVGTTSLKSPDLLIWATGRHRRFLWPPANVHPKLVLDLNYSEDSPGLEWAVRVNLPYQSGLTMFKLQADSQRQFWSACEQGDTL